MAASEVTICSNALLNLGDSPINDFTEGDRGTLAKNLFPTVRDWLLRSHPWNCAVKRVILAPLVAAPAFDYTHQFLLPDDWLRTLVVGEEGVQLDYKVEGGKILANTDTLPLVYVFRNTEPATWDTVLVEVMVHAMAWKMAYAITKSASLEELKAREFDAAFKRAKAVDGLESPPQTLGDFPLLRSRYTSSSRLW